MSRLLLVLCLAPVVLVTAQGGESGWCYNFNYCNDTTWPASFPTCNGSRQSPINIVTANVQGSANLTAFNFIQFGNNTKLKNIENTGRTARVTLNSGVMICGGGLSTCYDSLQFHLHWGTNTTIPGSEHLVDGKRYPMELHIVNLKTKFNGNTSMGVLESDGLAALGFFIEATNNSGPSSWATLTSYLNNITDSGTIANINDLISLDDLLVGVDRTKYYRYLGSLTTPACNEAVVWTLFKDTIKVNSELINLFSNTLNLVSTDSPKLTNIFRSVQALNGRVVTTQPKANVTQTGVTADKAGANVTSASTTACTLSLLTLALLQFLFQRR